MGDVGRTLIDQLQWFCLQRETEEFLIRFGFEDDGFPVETFIKQHFIWWEASKARIPKHEAVVHISDVANEQVVIGKDLFEVDGPNLFANGDNHEAECR